MLTLAVERARDANNFADCDVIQEAIEQCEQAKTEEEGIEALAYLDVSVNYREHLIPNKKDVELISEYRDEFKREARKLAYNKIINSPFVVKAYKTKEKDNRTGEYEFLKVENTHGAVLTIWRKYEGYQATSPIVPNIRTGSSLMVAGQGEYDYVSLADILKTIENYKGECPSFFTEGDRATVKRQTIEQAVEFHGNILGFEKVK